MAWASMKLCLRDKVFQTEIDKEKGTGYIGVYKNDKGAYNVEVRVTYKHTGTGKDKSVGKFYHRINRAEKEALVVAVFLVDVISHYGGRKSLLEGGGDKDAPDVKHRCFHEIFSKLPRFPENLVQHLNAYIPAKGNVPEAYRKFIVNTWSGHKSEVLRLFDICVAAQRLHPSDQGFTQTVTSIAFHGQPEPLAEEMEIDEGEASRTLLEQVPLVQRMQELTLENERLKASDHENKKTIVELRSQLSFIRSSNMCCVHCNTTTNINQGLWSTHIDKCLSDTSPITRAEADNVPSEIPYEEAVPMEEEKMTSHFEIPIDWEYLNSQDGEQTPLSMAFPAEGDMFSHRAYLEHDFLGDIPADLSEYDLSEL